MIMAILYHLLHQKHFACSIVNVFSEVPNIPRAIGCKMGHCLGQGCAGSLTSNLSTTCNR